MAAAVGSLFDFLKDPNTNEVDLVHLKAYLS